MKTLLILLAGLSSSLLSLAQNEITLSAGMSFPTGDFGNPSSGAAKIGLMGDIMFQHQTQDKSKLWLAGAIRFQSYKVDIAQFEQAVPGAQISTTNWSALSFLTGPVLKFDLSENISFEPRILLGYMSAKSPEVTVTSGTTSAKASSATGGAFATMVGTSLKFKTSNRATIVIGLDYLSANPKFNVTASSGGISMSQDSNQQFSTLNALIGLNFKLK